MQKNGSCLLKTSWLPLPFCSRSAHILPHQNSKSLDSCHSLNNFSSSCDLPAERQLGLPFKSRLCATPASCLVSSRRHSPLLSCFSRTGWVAYDARACDEEQKVCSYWAITAAFEHFQVLQKDVRRLCGGEGFRQIRHLWINWCSTTLQKMMWERLCLRERRWNRLLLLCNHTELPSCMSFCLVRICFFFFFCGEQWI